jgi:hypothetical protein
VISFDRIVCVLLGDVANGGHQLIDITTSAIVVVK